MNKTGLVRFCMFLKAIRIAMPAALLWLLVGFSSADVLAAHTLSAYEKMLDNVSFEEKYVHYIARYADAPAPIVSYTIEASAYTATSFENIQILNDYAGYAGASVLTEEQGFITFTVDIQADGLYHIAIPYYPIQGKSADIQRALFIDGALPFAEAGLLEFSRLWSNEALTVKRDTQGNDIKPSQIENPQWRVNALHDAQGYHAGALSFYLTQGTHEITIVSLREPMVIRSIRIYNEEAIPTYQEILKIYQENGYRKAEVSLERIEAENATLKSSPMLYPLSDHSSPGVQPYSIREVRINTIGSDRWNKAGQWLEWEVEAPEDGLYTIGFSVLQNFVRGASVYRKLTIDGRVPFKEAEQIGFAFKNDWRVEYIGGNDDPYLFYLEKGRHVINLEVILGAYAESAMSIEYKITDLNRLYQEINKITGSSPDRFRDYQLELKNPQLPGLLKTYSAELYAIYDNLTAITGEKGSRDAPIRTLAYQLANLSRDVEQFTVELSLYKTSIGSLGTWLMQILEQPLTLDAVFISAPDAPQPKINNSIFDKIWHSIGKLFYSFIIDYNTIGSVEGREIEKTITVWVGTGRDQANTMKVMIDENFTKSTGIGVNLMLVDMGTLLSATLARQGPDVAMQVGGDLPMNYGLRGAVMDLAQMPDFDEIIKRFNASALVPFTYDGKCYALPETQTFSVLFYRKDILNNIGLEVPQTWTDVNASLAVLSKNNLAFGMPIGLSSGGMVIESSFSTFLLQNGGEYYKDGGRRSALDSDVAINAFKQWTKYYVEYGLERDFDFLNRFRTGDMPIGIADYTLYNTLQVFAPEIRGLWDFTLIPGTPDDNGTLNRTTSSGGSSVVLMSSAKDKNASWEFLKWWTGAEAQIKFGREMEALMGSAARYPTANMEALESLPWPVRDFQKLKAQFSYVQGIPQVPGGYFTARNVNNAFTRVVIDKAIGPREALTDYVRLINEEIASKRKEFGMD